MEEKQEIKSKSNKKTRKIIQFILNPKLLLCFFIGWMITNGWSYVFLFMGKHLEISWMFNVASAYVAFLWLPFTPEKIITIAISIALLRLIFPDDKKTLAVLKTLYLRAKNKLKNKKRKKDKHS